MAPRIRTELEPAISAISADGLGRGPCLCGPHRCGECRHGIRDAGSICIGHHVASILDEMEQRAGQRVIQAARLVGLDKPVTPSMHDPDRTADVLMLKLQLRRCWNKERAFLGGRPQLLG